MTNAFTLSVLLSLVLPINNFYILPLIISGYCIHNYHLGLNNSLDSDRVEKILFFIFIPPVYGLIVLLKNLI